MPDFGPIRFTKEPQGNKIILDFIDDKSFDDTKPNNHAIKLANALKWLYYEQYQPINLYVNLQNVASLADFNLSSDDLINLIKSVPNIQYIKIIYKAPLQLSSKFLPYIESEFKYDNKDEKAKLHTLTSRNRQTLQRRFINFFLSRHLFLSLLRRLRSQFKRVNNWNQAQIDKFKNENKDTKKILNDKLLETILSSKDTKNVKKYISFGADIEAKADDGDTAIVSAANKGHWEQVQYLRDKGADIKPVKPALNKALMDATTASDDAKAMEKFLLLGADLEAKADDGDAAIVSAANKGHWEQVHYLRDKGADIKLVKPALNKALMDATIKSDDAKAVEKFLSLGADLEAKDESGNTPLFWATLKIHKAQYEFLVKRKVNLQPSYDANLINATKKWTDNIKAVKKYLMLGANVEAKDEHGETAIAWAAHMGNWQQFRVLKAHKANLAPAQKYLNRALIKDVKESDDAKSVELLLSLGAHPMARDWLFHRTALQWAAYYGHWQKFRVLKLKARKANLTPDQKYLNQDLIKTIKESDDAESLERLLSFGADLEAKADNGKKAIELAANRGHWRQLELLETRKANLTPVQKYLNQGLVKAIKESDDAKAVELLLSLGADLEAKADNGKKAIELAALKGHWQQFRALIARKANLAPAQKYLNKAMIKAIEVSDDAKAVEEFLSHGADPMARDERYKDTALHWAIEKERFDISLLLDSLLNKTGIEMSLKCKNYVKEKIKEICNKIEETDESTMHLNNYLFLLSRLKMVNIEEMVIISDATKRQILKEIVIIIRDPYSVSRKQLIQLFKENSNNWAGKISYALLMTTHKNSRFVPAPVPIDEVAHLRHKKYFVCFKFLMNKLSSELNTVLDIIWDYADPKNRYLSEVNTMVHYYNNAGKKLKLNPSDQKLLDSSARKEEKQSTYHSVPVSSKRMRVR